MICPSCGRGEQRKKSGLCKECEDTREAQRQWRLRQERAGKKVLTR